MSKDARTWFPLDAGFTTEDKITDAGERAGWLYIAMLGRIKLGGHHGTLTRKQVATLGISGWGKRLAELMRVGLVVQLDRTTYRVPAWEDWHGDRKRAVHMRQWRAKAQVSESNTAPAESARIAADGKALTRWGMATTDDTH